MGLSPHSMRPVARRRGERGTTLIEVVIASAILMVAMVGLMGTIRYAARANGIAHRRTVNSFLRSSLLDRMAVTPRASLAFYPSGTWVIDNCLDGASSELGRNTTPPSSTYACPTGWSYRRWINVTPNGTSSWRVGVYVERMDDGCTAANRYASVGCLAADLFLTD